MDRRILPIFLACSILLGDLPRLQAQPARPLTAEQVRKSIEGGIKFLLAEQDKKNGSWNDMSDYPGGVTALCTLALLNSGVEPTDPQIQSALKFLRKFGLNKNPKTYSVALQTMVFCAAEPRRDLVQIQNNVNWLESIQQPGGQWSYGVGAGGDNSNSQFAILALHEADRVSATVKQETWEKAAEYWKDCQNPDGSWGYRKGWDSGLGSMTCAGIAATVICEGRVATPNAAIQNGLVQCCQPQEDDDSLDRALTWLGNSFSVRRNPGPRGNWLYYYLYGLERVGRLTARRLIGEHDWYREGAEFLISQQYPISHHWEGKGHAEKSPHIATALALLFLSKGRRPVLMAKLQHGPADDWNNHQSDVAHLTARVEKMWGLDLTWQIFDPTEASIDDLLQAPVLFLSGSKSPQLAGTEEKIRGYLDRGGFLFAEACCFDGGPFEQGFRAYLDRVFPEKEYQLRRAGPEHPIWRVEELVRPESPYVGRLWTVEYGCRTCVVFSEIDLSCYWELYGQGRTRGLPGAVAGRLDDANAIGVNVVAYATNREPKGKEESFTGTSALLELNAAGSRGTIQIAKLQHGGGCNDAPGALVNLLRTAAQGDLQLRVSTNEFPVRADDKSLRRFHMAFMHGRHDFKFTPSERAALKEYLTNGGTLFADSICASKEFSTAFRRELKATFPEGSLRRIPVTDPLFSSAPGGYDIQKVSRRDPAQQQAGQPLRAPRVREVEPELEGIEIDGRWAVIFSPYDISCALEQHESLECRGYTQKDAARIGLNVLMYTLNPDVGP
ncbi:MAG: DUF4159 domain-containing protein [Planctomycetes bacterium]|nr:DUF4159 domain-containing protein [Planctomycetota bacterium]